MLIEEAVDDHDVRKHYPDGADLLDDFAAACGAYASIVCERERALCLASLALPKFVPECARRAFGPEGSWDAQGPPTRPG